jgi:hypothetical protein
MAGKQRNFLAFQPIAFRFRLCCYELSCYQLSSYDL